MDEELIEDMIFIISFVLFSLALGILIYKLVAGFNWVDTVYNASMVLTNCGPVDDLPNDASKILVSGYTIYSAVVFIILIGIVANRIASLSQIGSINKKALNNTDDQTDENNKYIYCV